MKLTQTKPLSLRSFLALRETGTHIAFQFTANQTARFIPNECIVKSSWLLSACVCVIGRENKVKCGVL